MTNPIRILHLECAPVDTEIVRAKLEQEDLHCEILEVTDRKSFDAALAANTFDLVLCENNIPDCTSVSAVALSLARQPDTPVLIISGLLGEEEAVQCLQLGAVDYLPKQRLERLPSAVKRALKEAEEHRIRQYTELKLQESEERFRQITENVADLIALLDLDGRRIYNNPAYNNLLGKPELRVGSDSINEVHPDDRARIQRIFEETVRTGIGQRTEYRFVAYDGSVHDIESQGSVIRNAHGEITNILIVGRDITARKRAEQQLRDSLREKEMLLREIQHRVKNNLQVIASMLHLQEGAVTDSRDRGVLVESQNRVRSMALVHDLLYRSQSLSRIDFSQYLRSLSENLASAYVRDASSVAFVFDVNKVLLDIDTAIPCGLIVNELLSNIFKHAFPPDAIPRDRRNQIDIGLHGGDGTPLVIRIADNGVGLPDAQEVRKSSTLGLQLIGTLCEQLGADLRIESAQGATFTITIRG